MGTLTHLLTLALQLLVAAFALFAQAAASPSGHWEGAVQAPNGDVKVEVDLTKTSGGILGGTFTQPANGVKGLPFTTVSLDGTMVRLVLKVSSGGGTFNGILAADGQSMSGEFVTAEGGFSIPFRLTRTGEAKVTPAPKSAPIGKELEGAWKGTLTAAGRETTLILTMTNHADGTATGTVAIPDGSGLEIPIAITQKARDVTIEVATVGASFAGVLNPAGTELAGTWTQQGVVLPLTFRK